MAFINDNFLLQSQAARRLYHSYAADQPILDYHSHMSPADVAEERRFNNLYELWLEGDHYKWRAMRANGIAEHYCSGDAEPYEKFLAFARTSPQTLRNPLYHWTHLELKRYFDIDDLLDEKTAPHIWRRANEQLKSEEMTTHSILSRFGVRVLCTTDDPSDSLEHHRRIAASSLPTRVYPAFRPDRALRTEEPVSYNAWLDSLAAAAGVGISTLADLLQALRKRHDDFHQHGCRLSDHGLNKCHANFCPEREAASIFAKVRAGATLDPADADKFASFLMLFFGCLDAEKGWTKQLHLGALRNTNRRAHYRLGRDSGHDSIGDWPQAEALAAYLDRLDRENALPKMILYNVNPSDNYVFATMAGNFQDGKTAGKIQFGSGWWFVDQKEGIEWQLNALSNTGLLANFIGMLTDSRSWMSFPRHEYFRRVLCNLLGAEMEAGLLPDDKELVGTLVSNICFANAANYLGLDLGESRAPKFAADAAVGERQASA